MSISGSLETNILYKALRFILFALLLTPLWFPSVFLFPFITTKIIYFRVLVEAAVFIYLILAWRYPEIRPKWNWLMRSVWIYFAVILVTSVFGLNFYKSFWGTIERGEGIITIIHFVIYFTLLVSVFRNHRDWYKYLLTAVSVIGFLSLYGLGQLLDLPITLLTQGSRINATIGNAAFFAAVLLFGIFMTIYLLSWKDNPFSQSKFLRFYLWFVLFLNFFILYHTQTRGAIVALAISGFVFAFLQLFLGRTKIYKLWALLLIGLIVGAGVGLYFFKDSQFVKNHNTLGRLATISLTDITTQSRLDTWQASWEGWEDRFLTGYGYENYNVAFNKYFPARIFKDQGSQIWFDRAHNIVFDVAVASGILGLTAYLGIFFFAFVYLIRLFWKKLREDNRLFNPGMILSLGLFAYFLQNLFVFDTQATYLFFFTILAHVAFLKNSETVAVTPVNSANQSKRPLFFLSVVLAVIFLVVCYFVNIEPGYVNYKATQGIRAARTGQFRDVKALFEDALSRGTYMDEEVRQSMIDFANEAVASGQLSNREQYDFYRFVIEQLRISINKSEKDVKNYLYLMGVYNRASRFEKGYADEVLKLGDVSLELSSTRPHIYFELAQALFLKNEFEQGLDYFRKAIEQNSEPKESHINYLLGAIIAGREDIVEQELSIIMSDLGYELNSGEYVAIARAYAQQGSGEKSVEYFLKAVELNPSNAELRAGLAAAYGEICDLGNARAQVLEAVRLNNSFSSAAQQFLADLEIKCQK